MVDLTATTFIDSSSPGRPDRSAPAAQPLDGSLAIVCTTDPIVKTFRITGLDGVFTIVSSLDEALNGDAVEA